MTEFKQTLLRTCKSFTAKILSQYTTAYTLPVYKVLSVTNDI